MGTPERGLPQRLENWLQLKNRNLFETFLLVLPTQIRRRQTIVANEANNVRGFSVERFWVYFSLTIPLGTLLLESYRVGWVWRHSMVFCGLEFLFKKNDCLCPSYAI